MDSTTLKQLFDENCKHMVQNSQRIRRWRAISWIQRAEQEKEDPDAAFLFYWIAFNSLYAIESEERLSERQRFRDFLSEIVSLDRDSLLREALVSLFDPHGLALLNTPYVYKPFWDALPQPTPHSYWQDRLSTGRQQAKSALHSRKTAILMSMLFDRVYVLRNQLVHGGATHGSKLNREVIEAGHVFLGQIVPRLTAILLRHPEVQLGPVIYPVVVRDEENDHYRVLE